MKFEEFVEKMTSEGLSNTVVYPKHYAFLPEKSIKLYDPQNPDEENAIMHDYSHVLYCLDEDTHTAIAYYGFYDKDFKYMLDFEHSMPVESCPLDRKIPYIDGIKDTIEKNGITYEVTGLYVRSTAWQIVLNRNIVDVYVDKREQSLEEKTNRFGSDIDDLPDNPKRLGNSINSCFIIDDNPHFSTRPYGGSLYSTDKRRLYHYFLGEGYSTDKDYNDDVYLDDDLEVIEQGALQGLRCKSLSIPSGVRRIEDGTLKNCNAQTINIEGALEYLGIDENMNTEFWINNSSDKVEIKGFKDIRKEYPYNNSVQKFRFAAPEANTEPSVNGFIKLTRWHKSHRFYDSYEVDTISISTDSIASYQPHPLPLCYNKEQVGTLILLMKKDADSLFSCEGMCVEILVCESCEIVEKKISEAKS